MDESDLNSDCRGNGKHLSQVFSSMENLPSDIEAASVLSQQMSDTLNLSSPELLRSSLQALSPVHKMHALKSTIDYEVKSECSSIEEAMITDDSENVILCDEVIDEDYISNDRYVNYASDSDSEVHSVAVIKSSEVEYPVQFRKLQSNTDLKAPPSNWLHEHSAARLPNPTQKHADFSSFLMAHQFPDCIGEVDVVSDAENIKKLLKIPYNPKGHVSMMIHRVGKTLLIDDFDIYRYLLRQSEKDWQWLRSFFFDHVLESLAHKKHVLVRPNKSRNVVQSRSLLSKFLYHSISEETSVPTNTPAQPTQSPVSVRRGSVVSEVMPEPSLEEQLPQPSGQGAFTRNVLWNFEDLRMLIGTDLPIFGGGVHPSVSLRLRDMSKPINVLTGIDYWLDNLMCNVPEVVMCYHLDGLVQKYELIKTEDLPYQDDSQFSPKLVRDVAQNILSFLNSKATKEGHTYWLFKGKDDDIVKLYDLTSLCMEGSFSYESGQDEAQPNTDQNPFTIPVAMLFYQVAKNMRASEDAHKRLATIRALLRNSLELLDKDKYPKIVISAHYMLSDLFVPQDIDPDSPHLSDCSDEESEWSSTANSDDDNDDDEHSEDETTLDEEIAEDSDSSRNTVTPAQNSSSIKIASLCFPHMPKTSYQPYKPPPLLGTLEERCQGALDHVSTGLQCLQDAQKSAKTNKSGESPGASNSKRSTSPISEEQQEPKMAKPFQPIPMPYSPLNPEKTIELVAKSTSSSESVNPVVAVIAENRDPELIVSVLSKQYVVASWADKLNILLLRKASLVYLVMARTGFNALKYGQALRFMRLSLHAWHGMASLLGAKGGELSPPCQALTLAGDIYYMLSKAWQEVASHIDDYNTTAEQHSDMVELLDHIITTQECGWSIKIPCDIEEALALSSSIFQQALKLADPQARIPISRRLGNICNELGSLYMNQAAKICEEVDLGMESAGELWKKSAVELERGINLFNEGCDVANVALLHSNTGRLLRLCAYYCLPKDAPRHFSEQERVYYHQAVKEYQKALDILKHRRKSPDIWDLVVWEYGTTFYTMASLLQDHLPPSSSTNDSGTREIIDLFSKALKFCDTKTLGARQPLYQYRAAVIYMRLAGIYHNILRGGCSDVRNMRHLAELNYSKASTLFLQLENPVDILKVHLDQTVLIQDQISTVNNTGIMIKLNHSILKLLVDCVPALASAQVVLANTEKANRKPPDIDRSSSNGNMENQNNVQSILCGSSDNTVAENTSNIDSDEKISNDILSSNENKNEETIHKINGNDTSLGQQENNSKITQTSCTDEDDSAEKISSLLAIYEKRLQTTLLSLIKLSSSNKSGKKTSGTSSSEITTLKEMYSLSLNSQSHPLVSHLSQAMDTIRPLVKIVHPKR